MEESFQVNAFLYFTTENFLSLSVIYFEFILQLCFIAYNVKYKSTN